MRSSDHTDIYRVMVRKNPKADKVLFYLTSYAFPWWVYIVPIWRFRKRGYEVVLYDFDNAIVENDDPTILPNTTLNVVSDMARRRKDYEASGITTFHAIGNSLGSYMVFNYAIRYPLTAIVLNGGGSIADILFHHVDGSWKRAADAYLQKGYDQQKLRKLWADFEDPKLGKKVQADKILITWSRNDGTIPSDSTVAFVAAIKTSGKKVFTETDDRSHVLSVIRNSFKVKKLYTFLNSK